MSNQDGATSPRQQQPTTATNLDIIGDRFKAIGYQQGLEESDERLLQSGFNLGFVHGIETTYKVGYFRGLATGTMLGEMLLNNAKDHRKNTPQNDDVARPLQPIVAKNTPVIYQHLKIADEDKTIEISEKSTAKLTIADQYALLQLILILNVYSKQLLSRNNTSIMDKLHQITKNMGNPEDHCDNTLTKLVDWINTLSSGRWSSPFAKVDQSFLSQNPTPPLLTPSFVSELSQAHSTHVKSADSSPDPTKLSKEDLIAPFIQQLIEILSKYYHTYINLSTSLNNIITLFRTMQCDFNEHKTTLLSQVLKEKAFLVSGGEIFINHSQNDGESPKNNDYDLFSGNLSSGSDFEHDQTVSDFM